MEREGFVDLGRAAKPRPRSEVVMVIVQPLARWLVGVLAPQRIDPLWLVLAHTAVGITAAALIRFGDSWSALLVAALSLQLKTLLDNADGGLARATGRVTEMGRYLDTVMDLLVNMALFAALARFGPDWATLLGFLVLTGILSMDFNLERLYRAEREQQADAEPAPPGAPAPLLGLVRGAYRSILAPQDRWIEALEKRRFRALSGHAWEQAPREERLAWSDLFSTASLVNLGLSTQLLLLGLCLVLGRPFWYVALVLVQGGYVLWVQLQRDERFRRYLRNR